MTSIEGCSLVLSSMESTGSEIDLATLVGTYSALLFRVAHSLLRSRAEAEDVVQDVFVRVIEHRLSLVTVRDMRVWLVRITWSSLIGAPSRLASGTRLRILGLTFSAAYPGRLLEPRVPRAEADLSGP